MVINFRYSRWDGTQRIFELDEERALEELGDELMAHGDVRRAMRQLFQRGLQGRDPEERTPGLRDMLERLRRARQERAQQYNLDSVMDELRDRLRDIVDTERGGIDRRLEEAGRQAEQAEGEEGEQQRRLMELLQERADRNRERLDRLPESVPGQVQHLSEYDFMDPEAQGKFQELMEQLRGQVLDSFFQDVKRSVQGLTPQDMRAVREMARELNRMLRDRAEGRDPEFDQFMQRFGGMFGPNPPKDLDELMDQMAERMAQAQALVNSLSPGQRQELVDLMGQVMDPETAGELAELASAMSEMVPPDRMSGQYPFAGDQDVTWDEAMELMGQLQGMDRLEAQLKEVMRRGNIEDLDPEKVGEVLGQESRRELESLQRIARQLEESGYLRREGERLELTPRAIRRIAQRALRELFAQLKKDRLGQHDVAQRGAGGERGDDTKPYEFGDPFDLDLRRTVLNGVVRNGPEVPVRLEPEDFEVHRLEHRTQVATVLLLDQSRSMGLFGSFYAAKRVALALYALIHSQFPRDRLHVVGFSDYAVELREQELPRVSWNAWVSGTNMQHAFMLSRRLLARSPCSTRQVIMITDGEPTAHLEGERPYFSYPPSYRTVEETLKEVKRCTRAGVRINTFMLESSYYLLDFVDKMTRINRGRAFYTTPDRLGEYVLVDYLRNARQRIAS